ncbi:MAG: hypothetical protein AABY64_10705 [Bdellovibrionota bacterium]
MMKQVILAAALVASSLAHAVTQTVTSATGKSQVIAVSGCTSPILGVVSKVYESTFSKVMCVEYQTYDVDIEGAFWNKKEASARNVRSTYYQKESVNVPVTNYDFTRDSQSGNDVLDVVLDGAKATAHIYNVKSKCDNMALSLQSVAVPVSQTPCAQQQ